MTTVADHPMPLREEKNPGLPFFRSLVRFLWSIMRGRVNWVGEAVLVNATTQTTVSDERTLAGCQISFMGQDNPAQLALATVYVDQISEQSGKTPGGFRINHSDPGANTTVRYCIKG